MPTPNDDPIHSGGYDADIEYHFGKRFKFDPPKEGWPLISPEKMFESEPWEVPSLMKLKNDLNSKKNMLNDFDLEKWHQHTNSTNLSGNIIPFLKKVVKPELVTQAWCKFYEICSTYAIIPQIAKDMNCLNTVHLCEAPGAFITALNHYLKSNHKVIKWEWIATSLNPHYEGNDVSVMINDDRFLLLTSDNWTFGLDNTGDLTKIENLKHLVQKSRDLGPILLMTADGSFDCQSRPDEQEASVSPLIFCEIVTSLHILSSGGSLVLKIFTVYEHAMVCLMYLLNCCFQSVHVCKPATSKEGNSENYVVCINYDGTDEKKIWLRKLREAYGPQLLTSSCIFPLTSIPELFIDQQISCSELYKNYQVDVLDRNIMNFVIDFASGPCNFRSIRQRVCKVFIEKCQIKPLESESEEIVGKTKLGNVKPLQLDARCEEGTFNDKLLKDNLPVIEKVKKLNSRIQVIRLPKAYVFAYEFPSILPLIHIVKGKPVEIVKSSKFCSGQIIKLRMEMNDLMELAHVNNVKSCADSCDKLSPTLKAIINEKYPMALRQDYSQFNFGESLWLKAFCGDYNNSERNAIFLIINALENAWRDSTFVIEGFPVLTQYSAGFIYILGHLFKEVHFIWVGETNISNAILFIGFKSQNSKISALLSDLTNEATEKNEDGHFTIHSIVPIHHIVENNGLYETIVSYNMMVLKSQLIRDGNNLESQLKSCRQPNKENLIINDKSRLDSLIQNI